MSPLSTLGSSGTRSHRVPGKKDGVPALIALSRRAGGGVGISTNV